MSSPQRTLQVVVDVAVVVAVAAVSLCVAGFTAAATRAKSAACLQYLCYVCLCVYVCGVFFQLALFLSLCLLPLPSLSHSRYRVP